MKNQIWIVLFSIISIASLAVAIWSHQEMRANTHVTPATDASSAKEEAAQRQMREIESRLAAIANRLDALERQPASAAATNASLAEVDSNIDTLVKSSTKNTQEVQRVSQQVQTLTRNSQEAFNQVAQEIVKLRGELSKLTEQSNTR